MKKFLLTAMLLLTSLASQAAWVLVAETEDGDRMLAEKGSFMSRTNANSILALSAKFAMTTNGEVGAPSWIAIDANSCSNGGGEMIYRLVEATGPGTKVWWSRNGPKMYDDAGEFLCEVWKASMQPKTSKPSI